MTSRCFRVEEIGDMVELSETDPRQKHLDECPRCRALMKEYLGFMTPAADVEESDMHDAEKRLSTFMENTIQQTGAYELTQEGAVSASHGKLFKRTSFWLTMAAAVVFAFFSISTFLDNSAPNSDDLVLREGAGPGSPKEDEKVKLLPIIKTASVGVELRWSRTESADAYKLYIFSIELEELAVIVKVTETSHRLSSDEILKFDAKKKGLLFRVIALSEGDTIAVSSLGSFSFP